MTHQASKAKKVLFVCVGNTCRSQIAEALARHMAADVIVPSSAGISPFGRVVEPTRLVLLEKGIHIGNQYSKGLGEARADAVDLVINMSGMPGKALFPNSKVLDWDIEDPYGEDLTTYRRIRDDIEERLSELVASLRSEAAR